MISGFFFEYSSALVCYSINSFVNFVIEFDFIFRSLFLNKCVLTGILLSFVFFAGCSRERHADPISRTQWKVMNYLPSETYYLFYMNPSELNNTSFLSKYLKNQLKDQNTSNWLSDIQTKTGIGIKDGIKELYVSNSPDGNNTAVIILDDPQYKIRAYLNNQNDFSNNGRFYTKIKEPVSYYYTPDDSTLVIYSSKEYTQKTAAGTKENVKTNNDFIELVNSISFKKQFWFAANHNTFAYTLIKRIFGAPKGKIESIIKNIYSVTVAVDFNNEAALESNWGCKGNDDAMLLSGAVKTALSMNLLSDRNYELNEILKKTEVKREGKKVSLNLNLNNNDLNQLQKLFTSNPGNKL